MMTGKPYAAFRRRLRLPQSMCENTSAMCLQGAAAGRAFCNMPVKTAADGFMPAICLWVLSNSALRVIAGYDEGPGRR